MVGSILAMLALFWPFLFVYAGWENAPPASMGEQAMIGVAMAIFLGIFGVSSGSYLNAKARWATSIMMALAAASFQTYFQSGLDFLVGYALVILAMFVALFATLFSFSIHKISYWRMDKVGFLFGILLGAAALIVGFIARIILDGPAASTRMAPLAILQFLLIVLILTFRGKTVEGTPI